MPSSQPPPEDSGKVEAKDGMHRLKELTKRLLAVDPEELRDALSQEKIKNRDKRNN